MHIAVLPMLELVHHRTSVLHWSVLHLSTLTEAWDLEHCSWEKPYCSSRKIKKQNYQQDSCNCNSQFKKSSRRSTWRRDGWKNCHFCVSARQQCTIWNNICILREAYDFGTHLQSLFLWEDKLCFSLYINLKVFSSCSLKRSDYPATL